MTRFLLLSIRFLDNRYHGLTDNGERSEWPPSPFRLFQALVAGNARASALPESVSGALRWLESLAPPDVIAPRAEPGRVTITYVLNNVLHSNGQSRTPKFIRPTLLNGDCLLQYAWSFDDTVHRAYEHAEIVASAARRIRCLGWGIDLAIGDGGVVDCQPAATNGRVRYRPNTTVASGGVDLRVPRRDSLMSLERAHADSIRRYESTGVTKLESAGAIYEPQRYTTDSTRPFAAFALRPVDPDSRSPWRAFRLERAAVVAAMLRHAACKAAEADRDYWADVPGGSNMYVAGHTRDNPALKRGPTPPRFSYLPLPSIGGPYPDGMIRRVLIAEPLDGDGRHAKWAATRLAGADLINEDTGEAVATLERLDPRDRRERVLPLFIGPSREWITATPIVLPGYDGLKTDKAAKLFSRACDQAGLPPGSVASFEFVGPPAYAAGAGRFFAPNYLRGWPLRWIVVRFKEEVKGPIALGAGRHCGLGVLSAFAPRA